MVEYIVRKPHPILKTTNARVSRNPFSDDYVLAVRVEENKEAEEFLYSLNGQVIILQSVPMLVVKIGQIKEYVFLHLSDISLDVHMNQAKLNFQ